MKNILIFSCTVQGFKKLEPVVRALQNRKDARVKTVVCGIQEIEYCAQNGNGAEPVWRRPCQRAHRGDSAGCDGGKRGAVRSERGQCRDGMAEFVF